MKKLALGLVVVAFAVSGCSTMEGLGKDISKLGSAISGEAAPEERVEYVQPQVQVLPQPASSSAATKVEDTAQQAEAIQQQGQQVAEQGNKGWF